MSEFYGIPVRDKRVEIPGQFLSPHYSDSRFSRTYGGVTVFLASNVEVRREGGIDIVAGAFYNYDDRLWQAFGYDKHEEALARARQQVGTNSTALYFEEYLKHLQDSPDIDLVHILTGVNRSNGFYYRVFGYFNPSEASSESI